MDDKTLDALSGAKKKYFYKMENLFIFCHKTTGSEAGFREIQKKAFIFSN
jgi:hypothetical protein